MQTYRPVRALHRGLDILAALNEANGATVSIISERVGLHRATVYRLLDSLAQAGYVARSPSDDTFRLTLKVRQLSEGFDDEAWVSSVAAPIMGELLREVVWPSDLLTFADGAMVVRESTHRFSRLSIHHAMVGRRVAVLASAAGRAYLAHCAPRERASILKMLASAEHPEHAAARNLRHVTRIIRETRERGCAVSVGEVEARISALAVPLMTKGRAMGALNLIFFRRALAIDAAVRQFLPALRHAADRIERGFAELEHIGDPRPAAKPLAALNSGDNLGRPAPPPS